MNDPHPSPEELESYSHEGLEPARERQIEGHLAECRDCGWLAHRYAVESRRIAEAMACAVPPRLSRRILGPRRIWIAAAAATAVAGFLAGLAWSRPPEPPDPVFLNDLCRVEIERGVADLALFGSLPSEEERHLRESLLAASSTTVQVFDRAALGQVDLSELLTTDTLAGLDAELRRELDPASYEAVQRRLREMSRGAAERGIRSLLEGLRSACGLDEKQARKLESRLLDATSWRRDLAFLPEFVARQFCVHLLSAPGALREALDERQAAEAARFLGRETAAYHRTWSSLRRS
jgi:hypothetical protein